MSTKTTYQVTIESRCELCGKEKTQQRVANSRAEITLGDVADGFAIFTILGRKITLCFSCFSHREVRLSAGAYEILLYPEREPS